MQQKQLENREKVRAFIRENPDATKKEACDSVGITYTTLRGHLRAIRDE